MPVGDPVVSFVLALGCFCCRAGGSWTVAHSGRTDGHATSGNAAAIVQKVDSQNGVDTSAVAALLTEARRVIIAARAALA